MSNDRSIDALNLLGLDDDRLSTERGLDPKIFPGSLVLAHAKPSKYYIDRSPTIVYTFASLYILVVVRSMSTFVVSQKRKRP